MTERDCKTCVRNTPDGCSSWGCDYINRDAAIRAYKKEIDLVELHEKIVKGFADLGKEMRRASAEMTTEIRNALFNDGDSGRGEQ